MGSFVFALIRRTPSTHYNGPQTHKDFLNADFALSSCTNRNTRRPLNCRGLQRPSSDDAYPLVRVERTPLCSETRHHSRSHFAPRLDGAINERPVRALFTHRTQGRSHAC